MADISKLKLPSGSVYNIKDAWSREKIGELSSIIQGGVHYLGKTTTELSGDGDTTLSVVIGGETIAARQGDMVSMAKSGSQDLEFIFNGTAWYELGSTGSIKALAFKDDATGSTDYTPQGQLTGLTFTGTSFQSTGSYKPEGSVSLTGSSNLATTVAPTTGDATYTPQGQLTGLTFTGTSFQSTGSYKPEGSVTTPAINLETAGATYTVHNPTANTVVSALDTYISATAPVGALPYWDIEPNEECLVLKGIEIQTGASIDTTDVSVKTGDASYSATQPTFTGTDATLSVAGTATGGVSGGFQGTGVRLETGAINVPTGATFTGTDATLSVAGTATGGVSGGFQGTSATIEITVS